MAKTTKIKVIKENGKITDLLGLDCDLTNFKKFIFLLGQQGEEHGYSFTDINKIEIVEISENEWEEYCSNMRYLKAIKSLANNF